MNEEEKTITASEPAAEKQTKPAKPKRTDEEKLQECYERRDRLREQKTAHKNKGQVIDNRKCIKLLAIADCLMMI